MFDVHQITAMQHETVARWHTQDVDNPYEGFLGLACQQHTHNFLLWHEEDIARSPDVGDARIAQVKRAIDRYNQQRNDAIEQLDEALLDYLNQQGICPAPAARQNTETPGSAIDRLSILALRMYHLDEQAQRSDASSAHVASVERKLAICRLQHHDLSQALEELRDDILAGRKRHRVYRQFKMYNDPALNPYLYGAKSSAAPA